MKVELIHGDTLEVLLTLADNSVDALVTDPPGARAFMGLDWDSDKGGFWPWVEWMQEVMRQCLRIMKPGAHGLVWSLPKTSHWTGMALELAGFEIKDVIDHIFGQGMPKGGYLENPDRIKESPLDEQFEGWGYNLKPSKEYWWLIQKPCSEPSIFQNVVKHGTGALNIVACKVDHDETCKLMKPQSKDSLNNPKLKQAGRRKATLELKPDGRWPSHTMLSHAHDCIKQTNTRRGKSVEVWNCGPTCPVPLIDKQSGLTGSQKRVSRYFKQFEYEPFFYTAKPGMSEKTRNGIDDLNSHPTVKPIGLMQEFVKLITPPAGLVIDPFNGSGTTGVAAAMEGFSYIGIDRDLKYIELTEGRLRWRQLSLL